MALILRLMNAIKTIEIRVFTGYSLLLTALSIPDDGKFLFLQKGNEGSYNFAYVDADRPSFPGYHERLLKLLKVRGVIMYDNTLWEEQWLCLIHLWLHKAENLAGRIALNSTKYWQLILASKYLKLH
ncbi:hypothetical protein PVL29_014104 [Vitis rotundifolia]|uniref:Caffeoyl-CoA O-methyltransferase n=1 Tax=Vitis rotundifolia TaxID=103349 RepID=A0AA38ZG52_VITRO|nr:hypothetical protein PVL29_014104 [Vitis rotundifolia]